MSLLLASSKMKGFTRFLKPLALPKSSSNIKKLAISQKRLNHSIESIVPIIKSSNGYAHYRYDLIYPTSPKIAYILIAAASIATAITLLKTLWDKKSSKALNRYRLANLFTTVLVVASIAAGYYINKGKLFGSYSLFIPFVAATIGFQVAISYQYFGSEKNSDSKMYRHAAVQSLCFLALFAPIFQFAPKRYLIHLASSMLAFVGSSCLVGTCSSDKAYLVGAASVAVPSTALAVCLLVSRLYPIPLFSLEFLLAYLPSFNMCTSIVYGDYRLLKHFEEFKESTKGFTEILFRLTRKFAFYYFPRMMISDFGRWMHWPFSHVHYKVIPRDQFDPEIHKTLEEDHYSALYNYYTKAERKHLGIEGK